MTNRLTMFIPQLEVHSLNSKSYSRDSLAVIFYFRFDPSIYLFYFCNLCFQAELNSFSDAPESNIRFLAMLAGPLYPILYIVNERFVKGFTIHICLCN